MINKWDLINKNTHSTKEFEEKLKNKISPLKLCSNNFYVSFK